jgi:hypothetical protein
MSLSDAFLMVLPALLLLLAVGAFATQIEHAGFHLHGIEEAVTTKSGQSAGEISQLHAERSREAARLREQAANLEEEIAALQRERASLLGKPQAMADASANMVGEAGYPTVGAQGQYIMMEGKAKEMPFCGLSSTDTALSARRRLRLVIWGMGPAEAQNFAMSWAGSEARLLSIRPFEGRLFWHEI